MNTFSSIPFTAMLAVLVLALVSAAPGNNRPCEKVQLCKVVEKRIGQCTRCSADREGECCDACNWSCHGAVLNALSADESGAGQSGVGVSWSDLNLQWKDLVNPQPDLDALEAGQIVVFWRGAKPEIGEDWEVVEPDPSHSSVAFDERTVWGPVYNDDMNCRCGRGCRESCGSSIEGCLGLSNAQRMLESYPGGYYVFRHRTYPTPTPEPRKLAVERLYQ